MFSLNKIEKTRNLFAPIVIVLLLLLTACGDTVTQSLLTPGALPVLTPTSIPLQPTPLPVYNSGQFGATNVTASLVGGGSTRLGPIYEKWLPDFKKIAPNVTVKYEVTNSGGGQSAFLGTPVPTPVSGLKPTSPVDFAASDYAFTEQSLVNASNKGEVVHIPVLLGAVVVAYHLSDVKSTLNMSGPTIANIFLGKITKWNDPAIQTDNPGLSLPSKPIIVTIRSRNSGGSGTADTFSRYLSVVSVDSRDEVGASNQPNWPKFNQVEGPDGATVAKIMSQTDDTIGFLDQEQADAVKLPYVGIRNLAGRFIQPTPQSLTAAAQGFSIPDDFRAVMINAEGPEAYPIVGFTYILVWKDFNNMPSPSQEKAQALTNFLWWSLHDGQNNLPAPFAPLPTTLVQRLENRFVNSDTSKVFQFGGNPILTIAPTK